jgi:rhodanese-related sulfurtransferase
MKKVIISTYMVLSLATTLSAYDTDQVKTFGGFFSHFTQQACADSKLFVSAEDTLTMIRKNEKHLLLDIRTEGEAAVVALSVKDALHIPLEKLFEKSKLDILPIDRPILIVCHSGTRATMAAMALKISGFKNIQVVKGGITALAKFSTPKNVPMI